MLKPEYLEHLPDRLVELYAQVETDILCDMARRIAPFGDFIPAAQRQFQKLVSMGNLREDVVKALDKQLGVTNTELKQLMLDSGMETLEFDDDIYRAAGLEPTPLSVDQHLQAVLNDGLKATMGLFENLTKTTARTVTRQFEHALDRAWLQIQSGAFSPQEAITQAVKDLCKQGVGSNYTTPSIRYPTGHVDKLDVAVRRAVLTGVNQAALRLQEARMDEMGCTLVEVSAHAGARVGDGLENPGNHAWWQGKVYCRDGNHPKYPDFEECTGYGTGEGLGGWNCRHSFFPFYEGMSEPAYTPRELEDLNAPKYKYNGRVYTEAEAVDRQRAFERLIRRWKREKAALEAAGLDSSQATSFLKRARARYKDFLEQTGLKRKYDRERVLESDRWSSAVSAPSGSAGTGGVPFDPKMVDSAMKRLEKSPGLSDNIAMLKFYAENTTFVERKNLSGPIAYSPAADMIGYNPSKQLPDGADVDGIVIHELAHRAATVAFGQLKDPEWRAAIDAAAAEVAARQNEVQAWFRPGGKYRYDAFFGDIISAMSKGRIETGYAHPDDDWLDPDIRAGEIFADLAAIDALQGPPDPIILSLYETFKQILEGGLAP